MSINKLGVGHARYYVEEAGDRVDAAESIGDGVEEYYTSPSTEARGSWFGGGARELGLHGEVSGEQLRRVLDGLDADGKLLRESSSPVKVAGYDLTLSAPKSVSVLFGLGDRDVRDAVRRARDKAVAREQQLIDRATTRPERPAPQAGDDAITAAVARRPSLSGEQQQMIEHVCRSPKRVVIVAGKAGTGKTFALAAAREAWQQAGHPVLGVAVARRAARELTVGAGIEATSTAALLHELRNGQPLPRGCVLVLDEAGMAPTRQLAELLEHVERADGKLVFVGDHRQLPEIEAGGAFRALVARGLAVELVHNQRQNEQWERRVLDHVADGHAQEAVAAYQQHGRIHSAPTADQTRARLVEEWWQYAKTGEDAIILAHRRTDVAQLNQLARNAMRAAGRLHGPGAAAARRRLCRRRPRRHQAQRAPARRHQRRPRHHHPRRH